VERACQTEGVEEDSKRMLERNCSERQVM
jgi:hypothetical protein